MVHNFLHLPFASFFALNMFQYTKFEDGETVDVVADAIESNISSATSRDKLKHILHTKIIHAAIITLIILDTIFVVFELLIDVHVIIVDEGNPLPDILHGFSIAILSIFMVEIACKMYVDHRHFLHHKIEVLDAVVVTVSFVVDIVLIFFEGSEILVILGLLILLRLVRITNGIVVTAKAKADERVHVIKEKNKKLEASLEEAEKQMRRQTGELQHLKNLLNEHGINVTLQNSNFSSA